MRMRRKENKIPMYYSENKISSYLMADSDYFRCLFVAGWINPRISFEKLRRRIKIKSRSALDLK